MQRLVSNSRSNLDYADDMDIISYSRNDLENFLSVLTKHAREAVLNIKVLKTKCMAADKNNSNVQLTIYTQKITHVMEFIYLGHKL